MINILTRIGVLRTVPQLRSRSHPSSRFRPACSTMVPAEPCVFETSRSYRNDIRVEIAATIRNRLISIAAS